MKRSVIVLIFIYLSFSQIWALTRQNIVFESGWNMFSTNVVLDSTAVEDVFENEIASGNLIQIKNESCTMIPETDTYLWTISDIEEGRGYLVKLQDAAEIEILGNTINPEDVEYQLLTGWNLVGCPYSESVEVETAFAELINAGFLVKVQSDNESFDPALPSAFNTLDHIEPGKAYWVEVNVDLQFSFSSSRAGSNRFRALYPRPWDIVYYTGSTVAYCNVVIDGEPAEAGDEVGAFIGGECRGIGVVFMMNGTATTFFNIQGTQIEEVYFNVWDASEDRVLNVDYSTQTNPGGNIGFPPNQLPIEAVSPPPPSWVPVVYKHSTTVIGRVSIYGESASEGNIIAAYVDEECRGSAQVIMHEGVSYAVINIFGEVNETINFKLQVEEDQYYDLGFTLESDPSEILHLPPDYAPFYFGELSFSADLPDEIELFWGDVYTVNAGEYIDYLFSEDLHISVSGNENVEVEVNELAITITAPVDWYGSDEIDVLIENTYTSENITQTLFVTVSPAGEAELLSVNDVPNDEGGFVEIIFNSSWYDDGEGIYRIQRMAENWETILEFSADGSATYIHTAETLSDSVSTDPAVENYRIEGVFNSMAWYSNELSGYSIDNLAPQTPSDIHFAEGMFLWNANTEPDILEYRIYTDDELYAVTPDTTLSMIGFLGNITISSIDIHENESEISEAIYGGFPYGDIDNNYIIEAMDASLVLQYICRMEPEGVPLPWADWLIDVSDVDGNDEIDAYDAGVILRYYLGIITEFPVEGGFRRR